MPIKQIQLYLDACATTPAREEVIKCINDYQYSHWGNPSSIHQYGLKSAELLERSRINISNLLCADVNEIIFTSGSTESINLALLGSASNIKPGRIVLSSIEHPAVNYSADILRNQGWEIAYWPVDKQGHLNMSYLSEFISPPTKIVSLIWAQSEIGTIQSFDEIAAFCRDNNIVFHTDATQYIPHFKIKWDELPFDLLSFSGHKLQGPKGIGVLLRRKQSKYKLSNLFGGGSQEYGLRSGTVTVELVAGLSLALEILYNDFHLEIMNNISEKSRVNNMTRKLTKELSYLSNIDFTGDLENRMPNHISFLVKSNKRRPISGRQFVRYLSTVGLNCSSGSACSSGDEVDSSVLKAIGIDSRYLRSGVRLSLGPWLTEKDIETIPHMINQAIEHIDSYN